METHRQSVVTHVIFHGVNWRREGSSTLAVFFSFAPTREGRCPTTFRHFAAPLSPTNPRQVRSLAENEWRKDER